MSDHLPPHSILEALRPDPGWRTDAAILSTYSLDLYAAVAALLALGGVVDETGSAAAHELAASLETLSDRVRILVQRGRVTAPDGFPPGLSVLDRFVNEQPLNELNASWHAKMAIVRYVNSESAAARWRCWVGSRNLTRAANWDMGVLLVGSTEPDSEGVKVGGIASVWEALTTGLRRPLPAAPALARELERVRWSLGDEGEGILAAEVRLMSPGEPERGYPSELQDEFEEIWIVSPFLGEATIRAAGRWGGPGCSRILVSTANDLRKMAANVPKELGRLGQIRMRDSSSALQNDKNEPAQTDEVAENDDSLEELAGLHAKFILARANDRTLLWVGSPNLTHRAWHSNAEAVVRLKVGDGILESVGMFVDAAQPVTVADLQQEAPEEETELEGARRNLSAVGDVRQERLEDGYVVHSVQLGRLANKKLKLSIGHITGSGLWLWPPGATQIRLPRRSHAAETELLRIRLEIGSEQDECVICAPLNPPPGDDRDRAAIANLLRPSGLLRWLAGLLEPGHQVSLEGERWERQLMTKSGGRGDVQARLDGLTLESILRSWTRDPSRIEVVRDKAERYLTAVLEAAKDDADEVRKDEIEALKTFEETWKVVTSTLANGDD